MTPLILGHIVSLIVLVAAAFALGAWWMQPCGLCQELRPYRCHRHHRRRA